MTEKGILLNLLKTSHGNPELTVSCLDVAVLARHLHHSRRQLHLLRVEQSINVGDASLFLWNVPWPRWHDWLRWTSGGVWWRRLFRARLILPSCGEVHAAVGVLHALSSADDASGASWVDVLLLFGAAVDFVRRRNGRAEHAAAGRRWL